MGHGCTDETPGETPAEGDRTAKDAKNAKPAKPAKPAKSPKGFSSFIIQHCLRVPRLSAATPAIRGDDQWEQPRVPD